MGGTLNYCRCTSTDTPAGYICGQCGALVGEGVTPALDHARSVDGLDAPLEQGFEEMSEVTPPSPEAPTKCSCGVSASVNCPLHKQYAARQFPEVSQRQAQTPNRPACTCNLFRGDGVPEHFSWCRPEERILTGVCAYCGAPYVHAQVEGQAEPPSQPDAAEKWIASTWDYADKRKKGKDWIIAEFERALLSQWKRADYNAEAGGRNLLRIQQLEARVSPTAAIDQAAAREWFMTQPSHGEMHEHHGLLWIPMERVPELLVAFSRERK